METQTVNQQAVTSQLETLILQQEKEIEQLKTQISGKKDLIKKYRKALKAIEVKAE